MTMTITLDDRSLLDNDAVCDALNRAWDVVRKYTGLDAEVSDDAQDGEDAPVLHVGDHGLQLRPQRRDGSLHWVLRRAWRLPSVDPGIYEEDWDDLADHPSLDAMVLRTIGACYEDKLTERVMEDLHLPTRVPDPDPVCPYCDSEGVTFRDEDERPAYTGSHGRCRNCGGLGVTK
jgi:hypothetical protein